jgi:type IV secretory pathway component VirB8
LNSVQIPKCPALNTTDFIITIFHANKTSNNRQATHLMPTVVSVEYVPTAINDADALTKPVGPTVLKEALPRIGLGISEDAEDLMDS